MRPTWLDFSTNSGFGAGKQIGREDFTARDLLIKALQAKPELVGEKIAVLPYRDVYNACRIVLLPNSEDKSSDELLALWISDKIFSFNRRYDSDTGIFSFQTLDATTGFFAWTIAELIDTVYTQVCAPETVVKKAPTKRTKKEVVETEAGDTSASISISKRGEEVDASVPIEPDETISEEAVLEQGPEIGLEGSLW